MRPRHARLGCLRVLSNRQSLRDSTNDHIHYVKELHDSNNLARFERAWRSARHVAARKHPADTKHV